MGREGGERREEEEKKRRGEEKGELQSCPAAWIITRHGRCLEPPATRLGRPTWLQEAEELRKVAETVPPGPARDVLLRKARQDETGHAHERVAKFTRPEAADLNAHCARSFD